MNYSNGGQATMVFSGLYLYFLIKLQDGKNKSYSLPVKNEFITRLKEINGITIKKVKSNSNYTVALMSDGSLLAWGANEKYPQLFYSYITKWANGNKD